MSDMVDLDKVQVTASSGDINVACPQCDDMIAWSSRLSVGQLVRLAETHEVDKHSFVYPPL